MPRSINPTGRSGPENIGSDIGLHRKPVFSLEKPVGSGPDFVQIFAAGLRSGLRRKRSDRFLSNTIIGFYRNRPTLALGKNRIIPDSTPDLAGFRRNLALGFRTELYRKEVGPIF